MDPATKSSSNINNNNNLTTRSAHLLTGRSVTGQNVFVLTTSLKNNKKSKNNINMAVALRSKGYNVRIITSELSDSHWDPDLDDFSVTIIQSWLPKSVFGYLKSELRLLKTILLAFWAATYVSGKDTVFLNDTCAISSLVLKLFGNIKVIYFQYFFQLENLPSQTKLLYLSPTLVQKLGIRFADTVLVQNKKSADLFKKTFSSFNKCPCILHPCVDI